MSNKKNDPCEVIVTSTRNYVSVVSPETGNVIKSYKINNVASKCLGLLGDDYFIGALANIPDIKMWPVREEKSISHINSPCGSVNALCVSFCGNYCVAALKSEIRVWDVQTGVMLASFVRHYQDVTVLKFTTDNAMFLSGGKDGLVQVWVLSKVTSVNLDHPDRVKPHHCWHSHSKEVTDIHVGVGGIYTRVASCSADMTCKIYELDKGLLLTTICFDVPITCATMNTLQYFLFLGSQKGTIYKVNLYNEISRELHYNTMGKEEVIAHTNAVTSLSMSINGEMFVSFSTDSTFKIWECESLTCSKTVTSNTDGPYFNAFFTLYPTSLLTKQEPYFYVKQLERAFASTGNQTVPKILKPHNKKLSLIHAGSVDECFQPAILQDDEDFIRSAAAAEDAATENMFQEAFRGETLNDVRIINTHMYTFMLDSVLKSIDPSNDASVKNGEQLTISPE